MPDRCSLQYEGTVSLALPKCFAEQSETSFESWHSEIVPSDDVDAILALAYYVVCQGKAFSRSEDWLV